jgi:tRNA(Ile)-lysidine synthase TilS/MesJ
MNFNVSTPTGDRVISIDIPQRPYGVLVSGGVDSSLMLALILMAQREAGSKVRWCALNIKRGFGTEEFSEAVVRRMGEHFGVQIPFEHVNIKPDVHHSECLRAPILPLMNMGLFHRMFSADTTNPPVEIEGSPVRVTLDEAAKYKTWSLPLLHCDKTHTVSLIRQLGLNFIETESHTCVAQDRYRCGVCFQCQERAWAYRVLGFTDPGVH